MPVSADVKLMDELRRVVLYGDARLSDSELLGHFVERRDDAAFAAIVRRHGPMVFGICRRVLRHQQDAEDAFQATFLVLARKAATLKSRRLLGNWLYGVARQTSIRAKLLGSKRN